MRKIFTLLLFITPFVGALAEEQQEPTPPPPIEETPVAMPESIEYGGLFWKTILTLVGILIFIAIVYYLLRRLTGFRATKMNLMKNIKVLEKRPLSPKSMLYLVEIAGKQFLLAESQIEVRPITQLDWIEEETSE
ncbi:MAG: flagellar biosynthetic protein FliO [Candidatus Algichlamydia australiensis]|nr:flagellar biosynthetic protein FliO [Chlamydiales bacterium]